MFKNYFKIAWRHLVRNKIISLINIFGLSTGMACCILITLYILNEFSFDAYQKNSNDIYQLGTTFIQRGAEHSNMHTPAPMAQDMQREFPEIQKATRLVPLFAEDKTLLQFHDKDGEIKSFYESKGFLADSTFFSIFTYNFIEGNPSIALNKPRTIVLSEDIAKRIFGNEPAMDKIIHVSSSTNGDNDFLVTGIFKPINKPSNIDGNFFISMNGGRIEDVIRHYGENIAVDNIFYTYLQIKPDADAKKLQSKFPSFVDEYGAKDLKALGFYRKQFLVNLKDVHLRSGVTENITPPGSISYLYILASIAVFILLIGCFNFMNFSTAQSAKRSAEVGIRKVFGARRKSLIRQFLLESVLLGVVSFVIALVITGLLLPAFNHLTQKDLSLNFPQGGLIVVLFFLLSVITGLTAGSYPAFYLSSFNPIKVLKGRFSNSLSAEALRKGLVVFQFIISVVLIASSIVIAQQMQFLRSADLGFTQDRQVVIPLRSSSSKNIYPSLKNKLSNLQGVQSVGASLYYPGTFNAGNNLYYKQGQTGNDAKLTQFNTVDVDFVQTLGIKPVAGRLFSRDFPSDTSNFVILNETAVNQIGFASPSKSIGEKIYSDAGGSTSSFEIIGVVKDFHFQDLHLPVTPFAFGLSNTPYFNYMIVHLKPGDMTSGIKAVNAAWRELNTDEPFEYSLLNEDFQKNYDAENKVASIIKDFTTIAILICCLGLFGLVAFSAEQRFKEIGIRKVLGASVVNIVSLLSTDFIKIIIIAVIIASPITWLIMNKWLQNFAYRINAGWWTFVAAGLIALLIALFTISFQSIKAAIANPANSLKTE